MISQERRQPIAYQWTSQPMNNKEIVNKIDIDPQDQVAREELSSSSEHFGAPSKNVKY